MDPARRPPAALRLRRLPARPGGGGRRRWSRPRRARGDADGRGQVALLPAAGADARGPHVVVSPLVSLMQDQVEALERVVRRRSALINAQRDAAANRAALERAAAGELRLLYVAPERFASPGVPRRARRGRRRPVRRRRGALRVAVGPRLPPRLLPPGRRGALARAPRRSSPRPRRRRRRWPRDIAARLGLRDPVRVTTGFDRPNLTFAVVPAATTADKQRAHRGGAGRSRRAARRSSTRARARRTEELAAELSSALGVEVAGLPRRPRRASARADRAAALHGRRRRRRRGHERLRHGRRQGRRADGLPRVACPARSRPTTRRPAARAATARPPGRCCSPRAATRGCTSSSSSARRSTTALFERVAERAAAAAAVDGRYDVGVRRARRATRASERATVRAIVGHLARAGVIQPAPAPADRVEGGSLGRRTTRRARAACRDARRARRHARPLAPVPRDLGVRRGRRAAGARRSCATSATRRAARRPGVPCCDVCAPGAASRRRRRGARRRAAAASPPAAGAPSRRRRPGRRSSTSSRPPSRRSGARAPSRSCAAGARRSCSSTLRRAAGLRHVRRTCAPTRCSRGSTS